MAKYKRYACGNRECKKQFSVTSGTVFAYHKLPLQDYLGAIAIYANGAKGHSMLQLSRDLDVQYKTAFVLAHKIRESIHNAMKEEESEEKLDGEIENLKPWPGPNLIKSSSGSRGFRKDRSINLKKT